MPRKPRIHLPGGFYHVILRGNNRQEIFFRPTDREKWQGFLEKGLSRYEHRLHAYCWMTNHVHMAIQAGARPLADFIRYLASCYARHINFVNRRSGHLFERRYRCILVSSDQYLLELLRYIHLNPVRAMMVEKPDNYPWSSHRAYGGCSHPDWLTTDSILRMLAPTVARARRRYRNFMSEAPSEDTMIRLRSGLEQDDRLLGRDDWVGQVLARTEENVSRITLEDLIIETCRQFGVEPALLAHRSRSRGLARVRAEIALRASEQGIATVSEVARRFGRAHSGLIRAVNRLRDDRQVS